MERKKFVVFTDGGCNVTTKIGGSAYIIIDPDIDDVIHEWAEGFTATTNNRMELMAFQKSIESLPANCEALFITDSEYCITVLKGKKKNYPKNMDLIRTIKSLITEKNINCEYHHIKGHSGNKWNEYVDSACTEAINNINCTNDDSTFSKLISKYGK